MANNESQINLKATADVKTVTDYATGLQSVAAALKEVKAEASTTRLPEVPNVATGTQGSAGTLAHPTAPRPVPPDTSATTGLGAPAADIPSRRRRTRQEELPAPEAVPAETFRPKIVRYDYTSNTTHEGTELPALSQGRGAYQPPPLPQAPGEDKRWRKALRARQDAEDAAEMERLGYTTADGATDAPRPRINWQPAAQPRIDAGEVDVYGRPTRRMSRAGSPPPPVPVETTEAASSVPLYQKILGTMYAYSSGVHPWMEKLGIGTSERSQAFFEKHISRGIPEGFSDPRRKPKPQSETVEEEDAQDDSDAERRHKEMLAAMKRQSQAAYGTAKGVVMGGIGLGIGSSLMGFFSEASAQYIQNADAIQKLSQAYEGFGKRARSAGHEMGYVVEQTLALTNAIGTQTNTVSKARFQQYAGFARYSGVEDTTIAATIGRVSMLSEGQQFQATLGERTRARKLLGLSAAQTEDQATDISLMYLRARAQEAGMGQGRFTEYLQTYQQAAEQEFEKTGRVSVGTDIAMGFGGNVFGRTSPRAQGEAGLKFATAVGSMVSGESSTAMRVFMMRALGAGKAGGPGFLDLEEQMEAGITDPRNANAFFKRMRAVTAGMSEKDREYTAYQMIREDAKRSGLNVSATRALITYGLSEEGGEQLQAMEDDPNLAKNARLDAETIADLRKRGFAKGGLAGVGKSLVTLADTRKVQLETMKESVGASVTAGMVNLGETAKNLGQTLNKVLGIDTVDALVQFTATVKDASAKLERMAPSNVVRPLVEAAGTSFRAGAEFENPDNPRARRPGGQSPTYTPYGKSYSDRFKPGTPEYEAWKARQRGVTAGAGGK